MNLKILENKLNLLKSYLPSHANVKVHGGEHSSLIIYVFCDPEQKIDFDYWQLVSLHDASVRLHEVNDDQYPNLDTCKTEEEFKAFGLEPSHMWWFRINL